MEAANKRIANILGQLLPSSQQSRRGLRTTEATCEQQQQRGCPGGVSVATLGRVIPAPEEYSFDPENGSPRSSLLSDPRKGITVESCRANPLDEKDSGFAYRLRGDNVEQEVSLASSDSRVRFSGIQVARAETGSGRARLQQELRLGLEGLETAVGEESRSFNLIRSESTGKQDSREWRDLTHRKGDSSGRHDKHDSLELESIRGAQSPGIEGLPAGGLKEQGLRGLSNVQIADIPSCQRGPFLPPPGVGVASSEPAEGSLDTCIFCKIVRGKAPAFKLYEDEFCVCILDINPLAQGHSLVIPKRHYKSLQTTPPQIAAAMCAAVPIISTALMEATNCDSFNLVVNSGTAAGQVVHHTHFHIIPRCDGDGLWHSETAPRRPFMGAQEAAGFVRLVRNRLAYL